MASITSVVISLLKLVWYLQLVLFVVSSHLQGTDKYNYYSV